MYGREAPPKLLEQLREIDPRADLVYWGEGVWILGRWNPRVRWNPDAAERLDRVLRWPGSDTRDRIIALERMRLRGFAVTAEFRFERNEDWGFIREDFRRRIFNLINRPLEAFEEAFGEDEDVGQLVTEAVKTEGHDLFKHYLGRATVTKTWD